MSDLCNVVGFPGLEVQATTRAMRARWSNIVTNYDGDGPKSALPDPENAALTGAAEMKKKRRRRRGRRGRHRNASSADNNTLSENQTQQPPGDSKQIQKKATFDESKAPPVQKTEKPSRSGENGTRKNNKKRWFHRKSNARPQNASAGNFKRPSTSFRDRPAYAALDLGTNNCRLLVAVPNGSSFRVVDAFSRIVRLGEGIAHSGRLSDDAMDRAVEALKVCASKLNGRNIKRLRLIATEACRIAENGETFIERVRQEAGLELEIVNRETEARLAVAGCAPLVDRKSDGVILFDIGGGSSELVWLDLKKKNTSRSGVASRVRTWTSLPVGVVNISERHGGVHVTKPVFEGMVEEVMGLLDEFPEAEALTEMVAKGTVHMLGTSGTVTTLAGVHLGLEFYDRRKVDGIWMMSEEVGSMTQKLLDMSFEERSNNACIGRERADLVLAGCAILEALRRKWPCDRLRVADRGLREGILYELMNQDGVLRSPRQQNASGRKKAGNRYKNRRRNRRREADRQQVQNQSDAS